MNDENTLTRLTPTNRRFDLLALLACLALALALRLPGLTVFLTADEARSWFGRSIIFFDSLLRADWANTGPGGAVTYIENVSLSPAPGVTTMWTGTAGIFLEYLRQGLPVPLSQFLLNIPFDPLDPAMLLTLRLPGVLVAVAAVGLTYWWSRPLLGRWGALLAAVFLALDPFYLALTRVLGHDALVTTFMWLSLLAFLRVVATGANQTSKPSAPLIPHAERSSFILLSGACAGLAFLSKYPALFIGAFIALTMLIIYLWQAAAQSESQYASRSTHHASPSPLLAPRLTPALKLWLRDMVLWTVAAAVVFIVFWPAMWVEPVGTVTTIVNDALRASGGSHPKGSFFLGQPVPDPGALFYPLVILFRTTPVVFFGFLVAIWLLLRQMIQQATKSQPVPDKDNHASRSTLYATSLILLAYIILYTLLVTYGGKKQDRYILPTFPAIAMLAAIGYLYISRLPLSAPRSPLSALRFTWILLVALVLLQLATVWPYFPYYFSYYNPLAGGGRTASKLIQVGWGEGLNEAAAYLNTRPNIESTKAASWYSTTFEPYFRGQAIYKIEDEKISRSAKPGLAADYVIFYLNQVQRQLPSEGVLQYFQASSPVYTVTVNGIDYAWIYPSAAMQHVIPGEARLVGQAELLGYNLTDEQGRPVSAAYPESVVFLSLFWEWQGKAEAEPIRISLVDSAGQTRGYGNPIETVAPFPYHEWQEGMVARDEFALVIFPDTPPGDYRLAAWIDRPATGETVGVFPLGETEIIPVVPRPSP